MGTAAEFRKRFEIPIIRGRDSCATDADQKVGNEKLLELASVVNKCIIRRTQALLTKYLPVKSNTKIILFISFYYCSKKMKWNENNNKMKWLKFIYFFKLNKLFVVDWHHFKLIYTNYFVKQQN